MLKSLIAIVSLAFISTLYVNCSGEGARYSFSGGSIDHTASVESEGNGQGYGGKIKDGLFVRQHPDVKCDQKQNGLQGLLKVVTGALSLTFDSCVDLSYDIGNNDSRVDFLPYNQDFIGFTHTFFERQDLVQTTTHYSEAWCRWTHLNQGVDAVVRVHTLGPVTAQLYLGTSQDAFVWDSRIVSPSNVQRSFNSSGYSYVNDSLQLQIQSGMNANGQFAGHLKTTVDGVNYDINMNCRMVQITPALPVITPQLVGLWQLNGNLGSAPATLLDLSGMNNNGVGSDSNSSMSYQAGIFSESVQFRDNDDTITVPASTSLNNLAAVSVSAWVRGDPDPSAPGTVNGGSIVWKGQSSPSGTDPTTLNLTSGWYFGMPSQTARLEFKVAFSASTLHSFTNPSFLRINPGQWHHVAVTWNGTALASGIRFYIDGQLATPDTPSVNGAGTRVSDSANDLKMGFYSDRLYNTFRGNIDQVQVWNRVLTSAEITNLYQSGTILP